MRRTVTFNLFLLLIVSACTIQQQNGQDIRVESPPIIGEQPWHITQQFISPEGDKVCTVSAGEMDVTQRAHHHDIARQVALGYKMNPGDSYTVLVGGHNYETLENWFDPQQSQAIIDDLMTSDVAYTEMRKLFSQLDHSSQYHNLTNKIKLDGFAKQYKACEKFIH